MPKSEEDKNITIWKSGNTSLRINADSLIHQIKMRAKLARNLLHDTYLVKDAARTMEMPEVVRLDILKRISSIENSLSDLSCLSSESIDIKITNTISNLLPQQKPIDKLLED